MNRRDFNSALEKHRDLRKEINSLFGDYYHCKMGISICSGVSSYTFNLRDLNRDLINKKQ